MLNVIRTVSILADVAFYLILADVIMNWVPNLRQTGIGGFISDLVQPILRPIRNFTHKMIPSLRQAPFDFSPLIAALLVQLISQFVIRILVMFL